MFLRFQLRLAGRTVRGGVEGPRVGGEAAQSPAAPAPRPPGGEQRGLLLRGRGPGGHHSGGAGPGRAVGRGRAYLGSRGSSAAPSAAGRDQDGPRGGRGQADESPRGPPRTASRSAQPGDGAGDGGGRPQAGAGPRAGAGPGSRQRAGHRAAFVRAGPARWRRRAGLRRAPLVTMETACSRVFGMAVAPPPEVTHKVPASPSSGNRCESFPAANQGRLWLLRRLH